MTDETRRINQARFTRSASEYAASRVTARREQIEALMALASPAAHDRVLDVACGPGALLATLAPRVRRTVGLDLTPAMLQLARAAAPKAWCVRGAAERLPFDDGAFSLVVCTWAFHHFASPPRVLREMTRVCAPGGRVVVGDLVGSEDDAARARQNAVERLRDPAHVELDSGSGLARLLGAAGLAVGGTTARGRRPAAFDAARGCVRRAGLDEPQRRRRTPRVRSPLGDSAGHETVGFHSARSSRTRRSRERPGRTRVLAPSARRLGARRPPR